VASEIDWGYACKDRKRDIERFPNFARAYLRAFGKMLEVKDRKNWKTAEDVMA